MEKMTLTEEPVTKQTIKLIDGQFSVSEAADIINSVLQVKINFHQLQRLSRTEGNINDSCEYDTDRINQLINDQALAKEFFKSIRHQKKKLRIDSLINITIED